MKNTKWLYVGLLILFVGLVFWLIKTSGKAGELDGFASCLTENGTLFYGAFWCPNCKNQLALFGRSAKLLPYVECSTPDGKGQLPICTDAGITGYPTWEFAWGDVSAETLSSFPPCHFAP